MTDPHAFTEADIREAFECGAAYALVGTIFPDDPFDAAVAYPRWRQSMADVWGLVQTDDVGQTPDSGGGWRMTGKSTLRRLIRAAGFAKTAHGDQKRKYTGEPYVHHCINVAGLTLDAANFSPDMFVAAVLHDAIEDTPTTAEDIALVFGPYVASLVVELTDVSKPSDGNRATRKALDRAHLAQVSAVAQTIKVCDLIDNTASIVKHDPKFARVYLAEKRALLEVLTRADAGLLARAWAQLNGDST